MAMTVASWYGMARSCFVDFLWSTSSAPRETPRSTNPTQSLSAAGVCSQASSKNPIKNFVDANVRQKSGQATRQPKGGRVVIDSEPIPAWRVAGQRGATANAKAQVTKPPGAGTWTNETRRFLIACLHQAKPSRHRRRRRDMTPSARLSKTHCRYLRIRLSLVGTSMHLGRGKRVSRLCTVKHTLEHRPSLTCTTASHCSFNAHSHVRHASHTTSAPKLSQKNKETPIFIPSSLGLPYSNIAKPQTPRQALPSPPSSSPSPFRSYQISPPFPPLPSPPTHVNETQTTNSMKSQTKQNKKLTKIRKCDGPSYISRAGHPFRTR